MWINRHRVSDVKKGAATRPAVLLTGARHTGKSSLLVRGHNLWLIEAKASEQPDPRKLNFAKVAPLLMAKKNAVRSLLACMTTEAAVVHGAGHDALNPLRCAFPFVVDDAGLP